MKKKILHEQLPIEIASPIVARTFDYESFTFPWHFHDQYELIYIAKGEGQGFVADSMTSYHNEHLFFLGKNVPHYLKSQEIFSDTRKKERTTGVIIQFESSFMDYAIGNYPELRTIQKLLEKASRGILIDCKNNESLVLGMRYAPKAKDVNCIINLLHILDLMAHDKTARPLGSPLYSNDFSPFSENRLQKVLSYLQLHYTESLKLNDIANLVAMNATAFCRFFKEKTGSTLWDYVFELRIAFASKLLMDENLDITQVALECGFNTTAQFNKIFKRIKKITPTEHRKQMK